MVDTNIDFMMYVGGLCHPIISESLSSVSCFLEKSKWELSVYRYDSILARFKKSLLEDKFLRVSSHPNHITVLSALLGGLVLDCLSCSSKIL